MVVIPFKFALGSYISNSLCDEIMAFHKNSKKSYGITYVGRHSIQDKEVKNSLDVSLINSPFLSDYANELQKVLDLYIQEYPMCNSMNAFGITENINIQYYPPNDGGYLKYHCERNSKEYPACSRHLVFLTYLNDVHEGGETEFYHQKIKIKPEKGLTIIFPSDWTFLHRGLTSMEEKYVVTGWFNFLN